VKVDPMKRSRAAARLASFLTGVLLLLFAGCRRSSETPIQGYVEGEYVYVSCPVSGELKELKVARGDSVHANDLLFVLDPMPETASLDQAKAMLAQAQNNLDDARKGKRPSEMQTMQAQLAQARASLEFAETDLARNEQLAKSKAGTGRDLDQARSVRDQAKQRVIELEGDLQTDMLGQRNDQIAAAQAQVKAREADLAQAQWNLSQKQPQAMQDAIVFDTLYRKGEWVPSAHPVVQLLPPANIKVRAFVPETTVGDLQLGERMRVSVDSESGDKASVWTVEGKISFISPSSEYTPPVIYSRDSRQKLVFMIEIVFDPQVSVRLHPGQPVDVEKAP
jgi:HlyD family secretion protein